MLLHRAQYCSSWPRRRSVSTLFLAQPRLRTQTGERRGFFHILKGRRAKRADSGWMQSSFSRFTSSVLVTKLSFCGDIENGFGLMAAVKKMQDIVFQAIGRCPVLSC